MQRSGAACSPCRAARCATCRRPEPQQLVGRRHQLRRGLVSASGFTPCTSLQTTHLHSRMAALPGSSRSRMRSPTPPLPPAAALACTRRAPPCPSAFCAGTTRTMRSPSARRTAWSGMRLTWCMHPSARCALWAWRGTSSCRRSATRTAAASQTKSRRSGELSKSMCCGPKAWWRASGGAVATGGLGGPQQAWREQPKKLASACVALQAPRALQARARACVRASTCALAGASARPRCSARVRAERAE